MKYLKLIRENLKDPKKKSLTLIGIYLVFFIAVFALIQTGEEYEKPIQNISEKKQEESTIIENQDLDYEYAITIYDNESMYKINGLFADEMFDVVYSDAPEDFNYMDYKYELLEDIEENSDSETKYRNSNVINYKISCDKYFELINKSNYCEFNDCSMLISVDIDKSDNLSKIKVDLTPYYGYEYKIDIEYSFLYKME